MSLHNQSLGINSEDSQMKFVMEFDVDNAFFHSEPYYNSKQKKETLDMRALGRLVADYGYAIACGGEWSGDITEGNGNSVGFWKIKGR